MNKGAVGAKTKALEKLKEAGFNVPSFVAISAGASADLEMIKSQLKCERYAVRSSALVEDSDSKSFAGQFMTKVDVSFDGIAKAIEEVKKQGVEYLKGDTDKFSLIIQEYIDADFAGVVFTRNPLGGREMLLEYYAGRGELVVGGEVKTEKRSFYWGQKDLGLGLPVFPFEEIKKIESLFGFPQDIEWCIKDGTWYFLQARPITTLSKTDYNGYLFLDEVLPKLDFFYEKTEISEIAPRPTTFTHSLLEHLYSAEGPVDKVYKKYKISYVSGDFLKIVGNELYVDREDEIKTLLPSYSYFKTFDGKPHFAHFKGFFRTLKNFFRINVASLSKLAELQDKMRRALSCDVNGDFNERFKRFMVDYELIFEINFMTEKALKALQVGLKNQSVYFSSVLGHDFGFDMEDMDFNYSGWRGNCLEIAQEDDFSFSKPSLLKNKQVEKWFDMLSNVSREVLVKAIKYAQAYSRLREYGRCLTVKNICALRDVLPEVKNVYFATIDEIMDGDVSAEKCTKRKLSYDKFSDFQFPSKLTSKIIDHGGTCLGVSAGEADGKLVKLEDISVNGKKILYTDVLAPSLVKYFDKIEGIVSGQGGVLSHLSIMARENGIPVVTGFDFAKSNIHLGDMVKIDGASGEVKLMTNN